MIVMIIVDEHKLPEVVPARTLAWKGVEKEEMDSGGWCSCRRLRKMCSALEGRVGRRHDLMGSRRRRAPRSGEG